MSRILVPDAGPLFSLAAGDLLGLLARFRVGITDIVREETIDRGNLPSESLEAQRLRAFYQDNKASIEIFPTQVGATIKALRGTNPNYQTPKNLGELSIQSLLIDLQLKAEGTVPVVLFEDAWFLHHAAGLAKPCILLSTQAFLDYAQSKTWIASAAQARDNIAQRRPTAYAASATLRT